MAISTPASGELRLALDEILVRENPVVVSEKEGLRADGEEQDPNGRADREIMGAIRVSRGLNEACSQGATFMTGARRDPSIRPRRWRRSPAAHRRPAARRRSLAHRREHTASDSAGRAGPGMRCRR